MSFLGRQLINLSLKPNLICALTSSFRSLSVTPCALSKLPAPAPVEISRKMSAKEESECDDVFNKVNEQIKSKEEGRLFAVVQICGKQFKVTSGDIILVEGYWPPTIGDEIRLEKVLLVGAKDFTLVGTPILDGNLVNVKATIIEKTLTHTKTNFKKKRRKQYMRINFQRSPNTMIRINTIEVNNEIDASNPSSQSLDDKRLF